MYYVIKLEVSVSQISVQLDVRGIRLVAASMDPSLEVDLWKLSRVSKLDS